MNQVPPLDNTFGAVFVAVVVGAVLYGGNIILSCAQVFYYFQHYNKKDGLWIKAIVVTSLICDTVHHALISHMVYTYTITYFFRPEMLATLIWSPSIAVIVTSIVVLLVQTFYAVRIWKLSKKNLIITATLSIFIVGQFVSSILYASKSVKVTMFAGLQKLKPFALTTYTLSAAGDILITIVFCVLLHRARTNIRRSDTMINLLIAFSVQTGLLSSLFSIATIIAIVVSPKTLIYGSFYFLLCRLHLNSLMATLNVRDAIRGRGEGSFGISLGPIDKSNSLSVSIRKEIEIETEITGVKSHDKNHDSSFVPSMSHTDNSKADYNDSELELRRTSS